MPKEKAKDECKCDYLHKLANDPATPVKFHAKLNEYHIARKDGGFWMIYYCPFCGGHAPKSRRDEFFHKLSDKERKRLINLTKNLKTLDAVMTAFGRPDIDQPAGLVIAKPERDGIPEKTESFRVIIYTKLSITADVHVTIHPNDRVGISFLGKHKKAK
jgi:hypothetical protein